MRQNGPVNPRTDDQGRAYKKSQLQIQIAVNRNRDEIDEKALAALPTLAELDPVLDWVSPLEKDGFKELVDGTLLDRIERSDLRPKLKQYWPPGGPNWDAVAVARDKDGDWIGPILVEAKSYPAEMQSACGAKPESLKLIEKQLRETRKWLRDRTGSSEPSEERADAWLNEYYQAANRLAFLRFFTEIVDVPAWLLNVLVVDDPDPDGQTSEAEWLAALPQIQLALGIDEDKIPEVGSAFIEGRPRSELIGG
jgi:hypothetical protein